jgi:hypothetical protein
MLGKVGNYAEEEGYSSILLQTELGNDSEKRPLSLHANHLRIPAHHFSSLKRLPPSSLLFKLGMQKVAKNSTLLSKCPVGLYRCSQ